jgi:hypothetical protein
MSLFIMFLVGLIFFGFVEAKKSYIIEDDQNTIFEKALMQITTNKGVKIVKADKEKGIIEYKTKMSIYAFGQIVKVTFKPITEKRFEVNISSTLNYTILDFWGVNQKNIANFEEQMGLKPSIATYTISS